MGDFNSFSAEGREIWRRFHIADAVVRARRSEPGERERALEDLRDLGFESEAAANKYLRRSRHRTIREGR